MKCSAAFAAVTVLVIAAQAHGLTNQDVIGSYRLKGYTLNYYGRIITEKDVPAEGELAFTGERYLRRIGTAGERIFSSGPYATTGTSIQFTDENKGNAVGSGTVVISGNLLRLTASSIGIQETDIWERMDKPAPECPVCRNFPEITFSTCNFDGDPGMTLADSITIMQVLAGLRPDINPVDQGGSFSADAECVNGSVIGIFAHQPCFE